MEQTYCATHPAKPVQGIAIKDQSLKEEIANSITHGIGAALSIAGLSILVVFASLYGDTLRVVSLSIYGFTLILLYLISTLYHSFQNPKIKDVFHVMDHCAIYLLIAGSYTPIVLIHLNGPWGWILFGLTWIMAICGIVFKLFFMERLKIMSTLSYVAMGWILVIAAKPIISHVPTGLLTWIVVGGLCYTFGIIFYANKKIPYHHSIWHLFVLGGSISHFFGILFYSSSI